MKAVGAIVARALLDGRGMLIGLSLAMIFFSTVTMYFFPTFREQGELMMKLMPSFVRSMMGSRAPFNSPEGFSSWEYTHPLAIGLCVAWGIAYGARAIAGGVDRGTLGLVLSAPVSRTSYFLACAISLLAGTAAVVAATNVGFAASFYLHSLAPRAGFWAFGLVALQGVLVFGAFGALSLMVSAGTSESGKATMVGVGLVAASVFITLFAGVIKPLKSVEWLSLFYYYHPYEALRGLPVPWWHYAAPAVVLLAAMIAGWLVFRGRDLPI